MHMCLCIMCMSGAHGVQMRVLDNLELGLGMIVSHFVGSRN